MLNVSLNDHIPSVDEAARILTENNSRLGIPVDYDRMLEYYAYYTLVGSEMMSRIIRYIYPKCPDKARPETLKDAEFLDFLLRAGVKTGFLSTDSGGYSMSGESLQAVIDTGLYSKELCTLIKMYIDAKACFKKVSMFRKIDETHRVVPVETFDNHRMLLLRPDWVAQNTGRLGTSNPSTMNMAREIGDIFTVPKGWVYIEVDSGQIEPRIIQSSIIKDPLLKKCTMAYNDAYYGYVHYCTVLSNEERANPNTSIIPFDITDDRASMRKKFKTFGNATMYGSTENVLKDPDKDAFIRYIGGHPNRVALQAKVEEQIRRGQRVFYTAFGTPIDITKGPSEKNYTDKGSESYFKHLVRCAINNPIQGTAADLMRLSIVKTNKMLLREAPNSVILQYVHDAGKFAIHESDYDRVIDRIRECTAYQVEDWIPIYSDAEEGIHKSDIKRFLA